MTDKSINQFNKVPNWLNTSKPVPSSIPNANQLNTSLFATPTDSVSFNFGLPPAASGAKAMDANTMPASSGSVYDQLFGITNLVNGLNASLAAAPMNYTVPTTVNTAAKPLDNTEVTDDYGDSKTDPNNPNTLIINNDNVEDNVDDSGAITLESGQTLKLTNLTESGLTSIDATTYESPNKVMIGDSIGENAEDELKISAKAGDTVDFSSDWQVEKVSGNKITLKNSDGQLVTVSGKDVTVNIDGTPLTEMLHAGMKTADLKTLLEGKGADEIAQLIQDNPTGFSGLNTLQREKIGKAYAVAYAMQALDEAGVDYSNDLKGENTALDYTNLVNKSKTDEKYKKALDAALTSAEEIDTDNEITENGLADSIPANSTTNADGTPSSPSATSSDELITLLKGDKDIPITKDNFDQIDFKKIMDLDPQVAVKVIKHMDLTGTNVPEDKKLTQAMKDRLAIQFATSAHNDFIVGAGVPKSNITGDGLNDNNMSAHDFHMLQDAARGCAQGEFARILEVMASHQDEIAKATASKDTDDGYFDKRSLGNLDYRMEGEPTRDLGSFIKNPD